MTAESCSGGGLAYSISTNPNASSTLERGFVTYSNTSKEDILKVRSITILSEGAVSKNTAIEMAEGALKNSRANISVATTGIAGPDKSRQSDASHAGLVWIACAGIEKKSIAELKKIKGEREDFCDQVIIEALKIVIQYCEK